MAVLWAVLKSAFAHDAMMATTSEQALVFDFYAKWNRPKGTFQGIEHRKVSCCQKTDCFPVAETRMEHGRYVVRPETPSGQFYSVNPSIIESSQADPRESPDGRSHVCIQGGQVVCFVEGGGI